MTTVRDRILEGLAADESAWQDLVDAVPPTRMDEPGPMGDWSFRELVSHLLAWRNRTIRRLEAAASGAPRPEVPWPAELTGYDDINDWFREQDARRSADDLVGEYAHSFRRIRAAVAAMPAEVFLREGDTPGYFIWRDTDGELESDFSSHLADHAGDVRAWLASR